MKRKRLTTLAGGDATKTMRKIYKANRRQRGACADCAAQALPLRVRCEACAETHRRREKLAQKLGRPDYLETWRHEQKAKAS
jgi:hypothetical protein